MYTSACSMGNKHDELEIAGYDLARIMETWWDGSHNWNVAMDTDSLGKADQEDKEVKLPFM